MRSECAGGGAPRADRADREEREDREDRDDICACSTAALLAFKARDMSRERSSPSSRLETGLDRSRGASSPSDAVGVNRGDPARLSVPLLEFECAACAACAGCFLASLPRSRSRSRSLPSRPPSRPSSRSEAGALGLSKGLTESNGGSGLLYRSISNPVDECVGVTLTEGGSSEMVFFRPRFVLPGTFGPTIEDVYFMISVSGGRRTPPRMLAESL